MWGGGGGGGGCFKVLVGYHLKISKIKLFIAYSTDTIFISRSCFFCCCCFFSPVFHQSWQQNRGMLRQSSRSRNINIIQSQKIQFVLHAGVYDKISSWFFRFIRWLIQTLNNVTKVDDKTFESWLGGWHKNIFPAIKRISYYAHGKGRKNIL